MPRQHINFLSIFNKVVVRRGGEAFEAVRFIALKLRWARLKPGTYI
jgi:hypothetical protein